jgi:hypothetical protein
MTESRLPQETATNSRSPTLVFPVDQIGVWTSTLCVVHCLLTPVVLSLSAVSAHFLPSEERTHRTLAVAIAALGANRASEGLSQSPVTTGVVDGCRFGLHLRWCFLGRSSAVTWGLGSRHSDWKRIYDRRAQNQSHILSRM